MLPHGLVHLNDAQSFGMPKHLHILKPFEWIGENVTFSFSVCVVAFGNVNDYPTINLFVFFKNFAGIGRFRCQVIFIGREPSCFT